MLNREVLRLQDKKILSGAKELIARELKLCRTLRAMISRELETIILDGDMDELGRIIEKKDNIVTQIQALIFEWRELLGNASDDIKLNFSGHVLEMFPDDKELQDLINQTHELAGSIMNAEDEAINELKKHSSGLRTQLVGRAKGKNVAASYARMGGSLI